MVEQVICNHWVGGSIPFAGSIFLGLTKMKSSSDKYLKLKAIYDDAKLQKLAHAKVAVIGLGGVGSYCAAALVRSGIVNLTIADFDVIEESNINRQLFATDKTIGMKKTEVAKQYLKDINSKVQITSYTDKIDESNIDACKDQDYVVDAIDDINAKIAIAKYCQENSIPLLSCMGTAMRKDASKLTFADIYETSVCPLCKSFRKQAKDAGIEKLDVLYSTEPAIKSLNGNLGSTSYLPPIAGMMLAGKVIESI